MNVVRAIRCLILPVVFLLAVAACGNGNNNGEAEDPEEIIEQTRAEFAETESARFTLEIDGSVGIDEDGMLELGGVEGEIERPASARADASVQFAGSSVSMEIVAVDGEMFLRNILTGNWERAPSDLQYDPARIFDEDEGVASILEQLEDLETESQESVNGVDAWHVSARVDAAAVRELTGDFFEGDTLGVDLWSATDDYRLLRVQLHDDEASDPVTWELNLTDHNEPVDISPPETG